MGNLTEAEQAFYEWFHSLNSSGALLAEYRKAFQAGWDAATPSAAPVPDEEPAS